METWREKKCLIAYFSREGENFVGGRIENLKKGNTAVVASVIRELTEADIFRIEAVLPYPNGYHDATEAARDEIQRDARPEITGKVENMDDYDVLFLGYPNWWGTMPMPVFTFLETYDFFGKVIFPFCTHEGSGLGQSEADIRRACPGAKVMKGLALRGGQVSGAKPEIEAWLK